jgi:DNA-directed RNA polymerase specialized sigma24 family protein
MSDIEPFSEFIRRIRRGDAKAAEELVRRYQPVIRLEVSVRLRDPRLRRAFDSMDICQSVMLSFFVRAASGQYEIERPEDLVKLLVVMARNKLAFHFRKERAGRRDHRRVEALPPEQLDGPRSGANPSEEVGAKELIAAFRQRLSGEERQLAERRADGQGWGYIASAMGGTADGRRKQLERAVDRVSRQLGLEDGDDGSSG